MAELPCCRRRPAADLSDDILHTIFSLLPAKSIARAAAVCKLWNRSYRTLQLRTDKLVFSDQDNRRFPELAGSVDLSLRLLGLNNLKTFKLICDPPAEITVYLENWMRYLADKQLEELVLDFSDENPSVPFIKGSLMLKISSCFFECNSVTSLMVGGCDLAFPMPSDFSGFGLLTNLCLCQVVITDEMLERVLATCPSLEILQLRYCGDLENVEIGGANLGLKVISLMGTCVKKLSVDAPNLRVFHSNGGCYEYLLSNLSSLVDAIFCSFICDDGGNNLVCYDLNNPSFLNKIANVDVLTLTAPTATDWEVEEDIEADLLPVAFHNLRELQLIVDLDSHDFVDGIFYLFQACTFPVLEKLFIELDIIQIALPWGVTEVTEPPDQVFYNLRVVKINNFSGMENEVLLLKFLLAKAVALELLILVDVYEFADKMEMASAFKELLSFPRASLEAQILLYEYGKDDEKLVPTHAHSYFADLSRLQLYTGPKY